MNIFISHLLFLGSYLFKIRRGEKELPSEAGCLPDHGAQLPSLASQRLTVAMQLQCGQWRNGATSGWAPGHSPCNPPFAVSHQPAGWSFLWGCLKPRGCTDTRWEDADFWKPAWKSASPTTPVLRGFKDTNFSLTTGAIWVGLSLLCWERKGMCRLP